MPTKTTLYEDLTLAMLAVNSHPLQKVYAIRDGLRAQGWFDPAQVRTWTEAEALQRLVAAGYDRGPGYNTRLADRLRTLALHEADPGLAALRTAFDAQDEARLEQELLALYGVGPAVVRNFRLLQLG
jgi:hypothetical protein